MQVSFGGHELRTSTKHGQGWATDLSHSEGVDFRSAAEDWVLAHGGGASLGKGDRVSGVASPGTTLDPFAVTVYRRYADELVFEASSADGRVSCELYVDPTVARLYALSFMGAPPTPEDLTALDRLLATMATGG